MACARSDPARLDSIARAVQARLRCRTETAAAAPAQRREVDMRRAATMVLVALASVSCNTDPPVERPNHLRQHPDIMRERAREARAAREAMVAGREAETVDPEAVLVTVNGEAIPAKRLTDMIGHLRTRLPKATYLRIEKEATGEIVKDVLISQFLREKRYAPSAEEIEAEIERKRRIYQKSAGKDGVSFEEALRRQRSDIKLLRTNPTAGMRFSCYVRGQLTPDDLKRTFETDRASFDGTQVRASHILFDTRPLSTDEAKRLVRAKAEQIRARALAGEDFARLAAEHSDCASKDKGGDLGFFPRHGRMVEAFAEAAFALKRGEISSVVETVFGYHIIKLTDIKPGEPVSLEDVRAEVVEACAARKARAIYAELRSSAKIEWPAQARQ